MSIHLCNCAKYCPTFDATNGYTAIITKPSFTSFYYFAIADSNFDSGLACKKKKSEKAEIVRDKNNNGVCTSV